MIKQINKILDSFIHEEEVTLEDFIFIQSLVDIILSIPIPLKNQRYFSRMSLTKSLDFSFQFLENLDVDYAQKLHFILKDGHMSIRKRKIKESTLSNTCIIDGSKHINVVAQMTIEDSYTITHEFFHYDNMDITNPTINFELLTEGISIASESLQKRWFERQSRIPRNYQLNERNTLFALKTKACQLHFELQLIYKYMQKGHIGYEDIMDLIKNQGKFYRNCVDEDCYKMLKQDNLNFYDLQRYIIGGCLAAHIIDRDDYIAIFKEIHNNCNQMTFIETLKFLRLEVIDEENIILSNKSLKLLKEEYARKVKQTY